MFNFENIFTCHWELQSSSHQKLVVAVLAKPLTKPSAAPVGQYQFDGIARCHAIRQPGIEEKIEITVLVINRIAKVDVKIEQADGVGNLHFKNSRIILVPTLILYIQSLVKIPVSVAR